MRDLCQYATLIERNVAGLQRIHIMATLGASRIMRTEESL